MNQPIYILAGVPGAGKSWVANQLKIEYKYVPHDGWSQRATKANKDYLKDYAKELISASISSQKPILGDCPFAERLLKEDLESKGAKVIPVFVTTDANTLKARYVERQKPVPKGHFTRAESIKDRAKEWGAFVGTSDEVLKHLKGLT